MTLLLHTIGAALFLFVAITLYALAVWIPLYFLVKLWEVLRSWALRIWEKRLKRAFNALSQ